MKAVVLGVVVMVSCWPFSSAFSQTAPFSRTRFYAAMQGDKVDAVDSELVAVTNSTLPQKEAFEGALLMKKAGVSGGAAKKLGLFKQGHKKLEAAMQRDSTNTEYRFLRMMIQEHAPGILGYKKELDADRVYVIHHYKELPAITKQAVINYSKQSKILKPADL